MGWLRRLRTTVFGSEHDDGFDAEARFHLDQRTAEYIRDGMSREHAEREARRRFGSIALAQERTRDVDTLPWLRDFGIDARYAVRILRKSPWFTAAAVATLALAVGTNTAIFAVAYGVLLRPLPYPEPHRLVRLSEAHFGAVSPLRDAVISDLTFDAWQTRTQALSGMAAYGDRAYSVTGLSDAERVRATEVSPGLFDILNIVPAAGRFFSPHESDNDGSVVLAFAYWQRAFGGRPDAIGQTVTLDGRPRVIIGIAPRGFSFPDTDRQLYTPLVRPRPAANAADRPVHVFPAIGRLAPGVTPTQAASEGTSVARGLGPRPTAADMLFGQGGPVIVHVRGLVDQQTTGIRPVLLVLSVGVVLLLVLGCANVANLCWSRGVTREREMALRGALGAGRGRLARQVLAESLVLSLAAAGAGIAVTWGLLRAWPLVAPRAFPRVGDVGLTSGAALYLVAASLVMGVLVGATPALQAIRIRPLTGERENAGHPPGHRRARTRQGLLVLQTALAVVLLVGAALMVRGFDRLVTRDTGYDAALVTTARVSLHGGPDMPQRWQRVATEIVERVAALPSVDAAATASMAPLGDSTHLAGFRLPRDRDEPVIARALGYIVTPGYADALRLRVHTGRFLQPSDTGTATIPMVVNDEFVRTYLTDGQPVVGRRYPDLLARDRVTEIVGVVGNVLRGGFTDVPHAELYTVLGNHGALTMGRVIYLVVRSNTDPGALASQLRPIVHDADPNAPVHNVRSLAAELAASAGESRFAVTVLGTFAVLALALAALGLHAGLMYAVSMRTHELGIRSALGASRKGLVTLVIREAMMLSAMGVVLGLAVAGAGTRLLHGLLFGVEPLDAVSFAAASVLLAIVALATCLIPAWRVATLSPTDVLRHD